MATKWVYSFGAGKAEGDGTQRRLLGGKGAGLAAMTNIGLPVPAGFTITVDACAHYHGNNDAWPAGLEKQVRDHLRKLERMTKKKLGDARNPLLVSVRSGAARSMPGMMETILNLGLNDESVEGLAKRTDDERFAWDSYRRFIQMYSTVVTGLSKEVLEDKIHARKQQLGVKLDTELPADAWRDLCGEFKDFYQEQTGHSFPQDAWTQLREAINAVFRSWNADKAVTYRRVEKITDLTGTAVNVQQMVFGNNGDNSGTGVCFTRDPSTGENEYYGEFLINAQGEDVVAGIRTPLHLIDLKDRMPDIYEQLEAVRAILEIHYKDMQDIEFTVEDGKLYVLQTRAGKRTASAAFRIAVDQASESLMTKSHAQALAKRGYLPKRLVNAATKPVITKQQAIARVSEHDMERLFYPVISSSVDTGSLTDRRLTAGINAVPGAAVGKIVFNAETAEQWAERGEPVVLVRKETSPEDVGGMQAARGILTQTGGKTSHAAVVARGWGKCCIVGCEELHIDYGKKELRVNGRTLSEGDFITLDGTTGSVYSGSLELTRPEPPPQFYTLMEWVDQNRRLRVRANADTPQDARRAIELGAEGIGLCRTEHMFFSTRERQLAIQEMIVANELHDRKKALDKLLPFQKEDFIGIFEAMDDKPVTVRLLDPPLHEFVPKDRDQARHLSEVTGISVDDILDRAERLHEANPMLGHRGCRLCVTYPEILEMQVRAIMEAAAECSRRGLNPIPEIMIPLTIDAKEMHLLAERTRAVADRVLEEFGTNVKYLVGTMIETPRAALTARDVAETAEFFSFGTNDLTQMTMGLSRDDATRFLPVYCDPVQAGIFDADPFQTLDIDGVGQLVRLAVEQGRAGRKGIKLGICGEHGGDPTSVAFCHEVGLDYVSCSPLRVPVARLAAAQASVAPKVDETVAKSTAAQAVKRGRTQPRAAVKSSTRTRKKTAKKKAAKKKSRKKSTTRRKAGKKGAKTRRAARKTAKRAATRTGKAAKKVKRTAKRAAKKATRKARKVKKKARRAVRR